MAISALVAVHKRTGPWHGVIAHSFGGAIATSLVAGVIPAYPPIPVQKLVLLSTPSSMTELFHNFGSIIGLGARAQSAMNDMVMELARIPIEAFEGRDLLQQSRTPTLVIHSPEDMLVPYQNALTLAAAGEFVRLQSADGLGHRRILYDPQVLESAASFMRT